MAEGKSKSKSRSVLGDVTNTIGKRGISGGEKNVDFNDKDGAKRICGSPQLCTEVNLSKGNAVSGISRIHEENGSPNAATYLGSGDVDVDCCSKGENIAVGSSKVDSIGKRGISGGEKNVDFNDKDGAERICGSTQLCTEVNLSKGNAVSGISRIHEENGNPNVVTYLGSGDVDVDFCSKGENVAVGSSKVDSIAIILSLEGGDGKNVVIGSSKVSGGSDEIAILGLGGRDQSRSNLDSTDNNAADNSGKIGCSEGVSSPVQDKVSSQDVTHSISMDVERPRVNATVSVADCRGELQKGNMSQEISVRENVSCFLPGKSEISNENDPNLEDLGRGNAVRCTGIKANRDQHDSLAADSSWTGSEAGDEVSPPRGNSSTADEEKKVPEGTQSEMSVEHNDQNADDLILSQSSSVNPEPTAYKGEGTDAIRSCSCPFCTKAAQVWLDLHHQDIKGRVSAIRKSQKEASALAERICRHKVAETNSAEAIAGVSKMESHLTNQWRCLFHGMASVWEEEGNRLETNMQTLAGLRGKCKADLGSPIDTKPSEEH